MRKVRIIENWQIETIIKKIKNGGRENRERGKGSNYNNQSNTTKT